MISMESKVFDLLVLCMFAAFLIAIVSTYNSFIEKKRSLQLMEILIGILEADDPNLDGHSLHVHNLCMAIYEFLPYSYRLKVRQRDLHYASLLLDIGKLAIPREIVGHSGKLGQSQWEIMKKHPDFGVEILDDIEGFHKVKEYILYHHERIDGKGYHQLTGDQIPLGAKIIAVADTYSAITMNRSYRATLPYAAAVSELKLAAGKQLDEYLVKVFCNIPMNKIDECLEDVRRKMDRFSYEGKD